MTDGIVKVTASGTSLALQQLDRSRPVAGTFTIDDLQTVGDQQVSMSHVNPSQFMNQRCQIDPVDQCTTLNRLDTHQHEALNTGRRTFDREKPASTASRRARINVQHHGSALYQKEAPRPDLMIEFLVFWLQKKLVGSDIPRAVITRIRNARLQFTPDHKRAHAKVHHIIDYHYLRIENNAVGATNLQIADLTRDDPWTLFLDPEWIGLNQLKIWYFGNFHLAGTLPVYDESVLDRLELRSFLAKRATGAAGTGTMTLTTMSEIDSGDCDDYEDWKSSMTGMTVQCHGKRESSARWVDGRENVKGLKLISAAG